MPPVSRRLDSLWVKPEKRQGLQNKRKYIFFLCSGNALGSATAGGRGTQSVEGISAFSAIKVKCRNLIKRHQGWQKLCKAAVHCQIQQLFQGTQSTDGI